MLRTTLRQLSSMSSYATKTAPFTRAVVNSMRKLYPESLADKSFDNTGLLLEAPFNPERKQRNSVLLTVDLTRAVADEAIERKDSVIVAYHPIIFRGLKSLTLNDSQQQSLLRLAAEGISVYSPHTAIDAAPGGMADWLCDIITGTELPDKSKTHSRLSDTSQKREQRPSDPIRQYSQPTYPAPQSATNTPQPFTPTPHTRSTIHPNPSPPPGFENAGMGRLITFSTPQPLPALIDLLATRLGRPRGFPVAIPQNKPIEDIQIRTVGICPGSGSSVLMGGDEIPDLLFTGEMSHHDALAAIERGCAVVTLFHSNSERGYLRDVMQGKLQGALEGEWEVIRKEEERADVDVSVDVSERDRDPYGIVVLQNQ